MSFARILPACRVLALATTGLPFNARCVDLPNAKKRDRSTAFDADFETIRARARYWCPYERCIRSIFKLAVSLRLVCRTLHDVGSSVLQTELGTDLGEATGMSGVMMWAFDVLFHVLSAIFSVRCCHAEARYRAMYQVYKMVKPFLASWLQ